MSILSFSLPFRGVSRKKRLLFYTQLEHLLEAGIPPVKSLQTIARQERSPKIRKIILDMADHILHGGTLSTAFNRHETVFPPMDRKMIHALESSGKAYFALGDLARFQTSLRQMIVRFWMNMIYPGFLVFTALVICPFLQVLFLGNVEDFLQRLLWNAIWVASWMVVLVIALRFLNSVSITRRMIHRILLMIPYLGGAVRHFAHAKFAKTFEHLYQAGFSIFDTYKESALACGNECISACLLRSIHILDDGGNLTQTLADSRQFSPIALGMISTGEESGKLDAMLNKYAQFEENEAQVRFQQLSRVIPVLIYYTVMGIIAYFIISAYMQYFTTIQQLT